MSENKTLEQAFDELSKLMDDMDNDENSLEKTFELYNEGLNLVKYCNEKIEQVEKQIEILEGNKDEF